MMRLARSFGMAVALAACGAPFAAFADVEAGIAAWERGDYAAAIKTWRPLAEKGDADAQFNLGQAYRFGRGVPVDLKMAEYWYGKAARQGHPGGEDNYGLSLFQNGKRAEAMPWIGKSAARGEPRAQYVLGTAHFNGDYAPKDWVRAYALMTRAYASGFANAGPALARMDQDIPLAQRQRGTAMARTLETEGMRPQVAPAASVPVRTAQATPAVTPPAAAPGASYPEPGTPAPPAKTVFASPKPVVAPAKDQPVKKPEPPQKPQSKPAPPAAKSAWRIQLGAFANPDNATALWSSLERNVTSLSKLQPYLVRLKDANLTRLQAGPFASRADADRQCAAIRTAAQVCVVVQP